jgi:hypothetical protein
MSALADVVGIPAVREIVNNVNNVNSLTFINLL